MKIDRNTTVEKVKQKTKDILDELCNIKNDESDNGKTIKELFDTYRTGRLATSKKSFSEYDFIRLFLSYLVVKGITKIDIDKLKFELSKYYKNDKYSLLFEELSLKQQIEGDFVELEDCLLNAKLSGLISNPIQGTNKRKIFIEEPNKIYSQYSDTYTNHMHQLVTEYVNDFVKDTCPQVEEEFIPTNDCRTCQNMSCRVEQNEKPVDECIGYINHKHDEKEENGKQLVKTIKEN